jgi:hypothetical protein
MAGMLSSQPQASGRCDFARCCSAVAARVNAGRRGGAGRLACTRGLLGARGCRANGRCTRMPTCEEQATQGKPGADGAEGRAIKVHEAGVEADLRGCRGGGR